MTIGAAGLRGSLEVVCEALGFPEGPIALLDVTLSSTGRLVRVPWPRPGHRLHFIDRAGRHA